MTGRDSATAKTNVVSRVGTWNVNTLGQAGKFENLKKEAARMKVDIMGVSEVRWTGVGQVEDERWKFFYSGGETHYGGVGILVRREVASAVSTWWPVNDRIIYLKIQGSPININIIQVYAPTTDHGDDEVEEFYQKLNEVRAQAKSHEINIVMGDLNAKIGEGRHGNLVGGFGLGDRNERGDRWLEWCEVWQQVILNTWFRQHPRFLWTWKSPGDRYRNQIDYITVNSRFRNAVTKVKTYPGADCGGNCDHVPVVAEVKLKLKRIRKRRRTRKKDWKSLRTDESMQESFQLELRNRYQALEQENQEMDVGVEWETLTEALKTAAESTVPNRRRRGRQRWMTEEILNKMEERRGCKSIDPERYRILDEAIKWDCTRERESFLGQKCTELELLDGRDTRAMFEIVREITGEKRAFRGEIVTDRGGNILTDKEDVSRRWKEYVEELFDDERGERPVMEGELGGPEILVDEVRQALKEMKREKAEGSDGVVSEMLEAAGDFGIGKLTRLANRIYDTGDIPVKMRESVLIALPKKPGAVDCEKHRTICLASQIGKVILRVIRKRMNGKIEERLDEKQYGFRKGKGTRNAIFILRMILERALEMQKDIYLCYIDFAKAFDRVKHEDMIEMLEEINIDGKDKRMIMNLYWNQKATVQIGEEQTEWVEIKKGVRQGCVLSPDLFNLYSQKMIEELDDLEGVRVGGVNVTNIRYADDTVLIADTQEKLQELVNALKGACEERGMEINVGPGKTEVMGLTKRNEDLNVNVTLDGRTIPQVEKYKYLGCVIDKDGRSESEVVKRIGMAKSSFGKVRKVLTNMELDLRIRLRLLKCFVWSVLLYGSEAWTLDKKLKKRLEAAEMWFLRRMLRVPWTARMTNERVLELAGVGRELLRVVRTRQLRFLGHLLRRNGLEKEALLGRIEGTRARGRPRIKYSASLMEDIPGDLRFVDLVEMAQDRREWRSMVAHVDQDMAHR